MPTSAIKNALTFLIAFPSIPLTIGAGIGGAVDWIGAFLGVTGLILFNFAFKYVLIFPASSIKLTKFSQAPLAGWDSVSVIAPLVVGVVSFFVFSFWEIKVAKSPILPFDIWKAPTFVAVISSAFLSFMSFGIFIFCNLFCFLFYSAI